MINKLYFEKKLHQEMMMESKIHFPPYNSCINVHSRKRKQAYTASTTLYNKKSKIGARWMSLSKETLVIVTTVIHQMVVALYY